MIANVEYREVLLRADKLSLALGGRSVLRDVSFEVRDIVRPGCITGQVVALLGPSGMGKTQLFRVLAGLQDADAGSVLVDMAQHPVRAGQVGVVAQAYPLFEHRTVLGNLLVAGRTADREVRARMLLERFGLAQLADRWPLELSGGQRQRVAIAQQFMCSEHLLLMDEPFSGLDPLAVEEVCALIREVASQDELNTIVIVTHDIAAALSVADHVWLLGRDRDAKGEPIAGARIQATFDLVERGLAWRTDSLRSKEFQDLEHEIRETFKKL